MYRLHVAGLEINAPNSFWSCFAIPKLVKNKKQSLKINWNFKQEKNSNAFLETVSPDFAE